MLDQCRQQAQASQDHARDADLKQRKRLKLEEPVRA
jgi:hypothetical protein